MIKSRRIKLTEHVTRRSKMKMSAKFWLEILKEETTWKTKGKAGNNIKIFSG
jgi:hypothetical protein